VDLVVFGATGRVGSVVVERALARGHDVTAFVRAPERLGPVADLVAVIIGDAVDAPAVEAALAGRDAAVAALGPRRQDTTELSDAGLGVIRGAEAAGLPRLAVVSQIGVLLRKTRPEFEHIRAEHLRVVEALRASSLTWVALAVPGIEDRPGDGRYSTVVEGRPPGWSIARTDLADALLDALEREDWARHVVGISGPAE
jgi:uncharacterized protein YbjT (DUF2867 family)